MARIDQINTPLLLLHGTRDRIVPPDMVQQLFARSEEPKTLHLIEGAGHNDTLSHHQHDYWLTWRTFIESVVATDKQSPLRPQSEAL